MMIACPPQELGCKAIRRRRRRRHPCLFQRVGRIAIAAGMEVIGHDNDDDDDDDVAFRDAVKW